MALPLYRFMIDENDHTGVTAVALVDRPAIELNWQAFNSQKSKFEAVSTEKRIIAGPLMLANTPIPRINKTVGEYEAIFYPEDIEKIVDKYHKNEFGKNVNPMHNSMLLLPDIYMISDFIINKPLGFVSPMGYDLPDGSWFGMFKVRNDEIWNSFIKTGEFKGFSVEGFFNETLVEPFTDEDIRLISELVS